MEARCRRLSWWTGGMAGVCVLLTHWLTYTLVLPDAGHRAEVLDHTGHVHLPVTSAIALALFTVASLRLCVLGAVGGRFPGLRATAFRLAVLQAVAWTAMEVGERAVSGELVTLDDHGLFVAGVVLQVGVALLAALLLRLASAVLAVVALPRTSPRPRRRSVRLPARSRPPRPMPPLTGAHALRGPPRLRPTS